VLADGSYDVLVLDAEPADDGSVLELDLTVLAGPHKGDVVVVRATGIDRDAIDLLGVPGTLTVQGGEPSVQLED
jgi:hypothetical protein